MSLRALDGKLLPHQLGHVPGRRDEDEAGDARCLPGRLRHQRAQQQERHVAAHAGPDEHLRAVCQAGAGGARLLQPAADRAVLEPAIGLAMPGVVEPEACTPLRRRPFRHRGRLGAGHLRFEAA